MKNAPSNQRISNRWPWLLLLFASLLLGAAVTYLERDSLTLHLVNQMLRPYDIEVIRIDGARLSLTTLDVDTIEIRIPQSPDLQTIKRAQLHFDKFELIRGNFNSLTADQATLSIPFLGSEEGLHASVNDLNVACQSAQVCSGSAQLQIDVGAVDVKEGGLQSSASQLSSSLNFSYKAGQLNLSLPPGLQILFESASYGDFRLEQLALASSQEWQAQLNLAEQTFLLTAGSTSLTFDTEGPVNAEVRISHIIGSCSGLDNCEAEAHLQLNVNSFESEELGLVIAGLGFVGDLKLRYQASDLNLIIPADFKVTLATANYGDFRLEQLVLDSSQDWQAQLNLAEQTLALNAGSTNLVFDTQGIMDSKVSISQMIGSCSALNNCEAKGRMDLMMNSFESQESGLAVAGLGVVSDVELRFQDSNLNVIMPADASVILASGDYPGYRIEQLEVMTQALWQIDVNLPEQSASINAGSTLFKLPVFRTRTDSETPSLSGLTLHLQQLDMHFDLSTTQSRPWHQQLSGSAELDASQVYTTLAPYNFWPYQWHTHVQWLNADQLLIELLAKHSENPLFSIKLDHSINNKQGKANFKLEALNFSPAGAHLSSYISPLPVDADLLDGSVALEGNVAWHADPASNIWQPEGQIQLELRKLAGFMDEIVFSGLEASSVWSLRPDYSIATQSAFVLNIREIDPGIPLINVQSSVSVDSASGLIHLRSPHAEVFGGTVSADRIEIFLPQENRAEELGETFDIAIEAIDIAQVLSLSAYEQVSATGIISGVLPVRFKGLKPVIEAGQLSASQQGGSIRYDQGGIASGNQNLDLVYQALEHYQYDSLSAGVDFDEHGELILALQMRGQSPNVGQGQRINLNLNISDNIPALLQSLQAADNMAERLQDMLE
ncbi:MAG: YdbH domain-containing protein [Pseudohongiella sp.]|nr:YdbH domain-containing protein [Pseudohongiella sp.]